MATIKGMLDWPMKTSVAGWEPLTAAVSLMNNIYMGTMGKPVVMVTLAPGAKIEGEFEVIIHYTHNQPLLELMFHWGAFIGKDQLPYYRDLFKKYYPSGF